MKKLSLFVLITILFSAVSFKSSYCEGFEAGFKKGYCYNKGFGCITPIVPICPLPRIGETSWNDGYNRGFMLGISN